MVDKDSEIFCSGALLSETHILSAAHCLKEYDENPGMKRIVLIGGSSKRRFISYVFTKNKLHELSEGQIVHPDFQKFNWRGEKGTFYIFDLTIFSLKVPLTQICSSAFARLPSERFNDQYLSDKQLTVSGWGSILELSHDQLIDLIDENYDNFETNPFDFPTHLRVVKVRYLQYRLCQDRYKSFFQRHRRTPSNKGNLKVGDVDIKQHGMICTSMCTKKDVENCLHYHDAIGVCLGDSGCKLITNLNAVKIISNW